MSRRSLHTRTRRVYLLWGHAVISLRVRPGLSMWGGLVFRACVQGMRARAVCEDSIVVWASVNMRSSSLHISSLVCGRRASL
jgi:hypothetical protein